MIGNSIRAERSRAHLSQEALASLIGIDERTLRRWEQDKVDVPVGQLIRIAGALKCPIERFFIDQPSVINDQKELVHR